MSQASLPHLRRIVAKLGRAGRALTSVEIAAEALGLVDPPRDLAERLVGDLLDSDERFERTPDGWILRDDRPISTSSVRLDASAVALLRAADGSTHRIPSERERAPATLTVHLGRAGADAFAPTRDAVDILALARLRRGYVGPADPIALAEHLGVPHEDDGSLEAGARALFGAWALLRDELATEGIEDVDGAQRLLERALEPADFSRKAFDASDVEELSAGPGVYVFSQWTGRTLYVGQSTTLRARVRSYFTGPPRDDKDRRIRDEAVRLTTFRAETGVDALIREARLIRHRAPVLNTRREIRREGIEDGILRVRGGGPVARDVFFVCAGGRLVLRAASAGRSGVGRVARRVAEALFRPPSAGNPEAAALVATWRVAHPSDCFLRPAIDGDEEDVARRIESDLRADPDQGS
jgi:hypothetical protein